MSICWKFYISCDSEKTLARFLEAVFLSKFTKLLHVCIFQDLTNAYVINLHAVNLTPHGFPLSRKFSCYVKAPTYYSTFVLFSWSHLDYHVWSKNFWKTHSFTTNFTESLNVWISMKTKPTDCQTKQMQYWMRKPQWNFVIRTIKTRTKHWYGDCWKYLVSTKKFHLMKSGHL